MNTSGRIVADPVGMLGSASVDHPCTNILKFVDFCKTVQPQSREDIQRFFEGVVCFPYDDELLLQAFLFLNIQSYFPSCTDLLLYEKAPNGKNTDQGKYDFVYLTCDGILLIETKFIDTQNVGATERTRRNQHRAKVFKQVLELKQKFSNEWKMPLKLIACSVFTTEDLTHREEACDTAAKHVSIVKLKEWQAEFKSRLHTNS